MRRRPVTIALCAAAALAAGCGGSGGGLGPSPRTGKGGGTAGAATELGFPSFATKNTTRVGGSDAVADAAAVSRAVFPGGGQAPATVVLASKDDWRAALAATPLGAQPFRGAILLAGSDSLPSATADALLALRPQGATAANGAQVVRVGNVAAPPQRLRTATVKASTPAGLAAAVDRFRTTAAGRPSDAVVVVSQDAPAYAMPAGAWAAKSGDGVLYVTRAGIPSETAAELRARGRTRIYVLGPPAVVSDAVLRGLRAFGPVKRVGAADPVRNAIAFARYSDGSFGWRIVDPGHGLVFVNSGRPLDAAAAAPLSASGTYGPLLLVDRPAPLPTAVESYLLDIEPGYSADPVRGVYNHGWLIGDEQAIAQSSQARIDALLEIAPVSGTTP